jgi:hypothetical protein
VCCSCFAATSCYCYGYFLLRSTLLLRLLLLLLLLLQEWVWCGPWCWAALSSTTVKQLTTAVGAVFAAVLLSLLLCGFGCAECGVPIMSVHTTIAQLINTVCAPALLLLLLLLLLQVWVWCGPWSWAALSSITAGCSPARSMTG